MNKIELLKLKDIPFLMPEIGKKNMTITAFDLTMKQNGMGTLGQ